MSLLIRNDLLTNNPVSRESQAKPNDAEWARYDWEAMDQAVAMTQEEGLYFLVDYHNWLVNDTIHVHEQEWLRTWGWIINR